MKKMTKKQLQEFNKEVIEILEFYGTERLNERTFKMDSEKIGELYITLDDTVSAVYTIYARFEDEKACKYFNVRPYNLKINTHEFSPDPCLFHIDSLLDNYCQIIGINPHERYLAQ